MQADPEFIKKARVRYLKCQQGGLHQGEVLNFICIDPKCRQKGLICPVCQSAQHATHETLHLKVFLSEINRTLYAQSDSSDPAGLADYLRSIDQAKRNMLKALRETVEKLAGQVRVIEDKIENNFRELRKIILAQSTVSVQLPELYKLLTDSQCTLDEQQVRRQVGRYSELLELRKDKIISVDSAKSLVSEYNNKAGVLTAQLTAVVIQAGKIFDALPLAIDKFGSAKEEEEKKTEENMAFSKEFHSSGCKIEEGQRKVTVKEDSMGAIIFTPAQKGSNPKAAFKVVESPTGGAITIGVANAANFKQNNYEINFQGEQGLFGMCSFGFFPEQLDGAAFMYGVGDIIEVSLNVADRKMVLTRRHSIEKAEVQLPIDSTQAGNLSFFVMATGPGDSIEIVQ